MPCKAVLTSRCESKILPVFHVRLLFEPICNIHRHINTIDTLSHVDVVETCQIRLGGPTTIKAVVETLALKMRPSSFAKILASQNRCSMITHNHVWSADHRMLAQIV